jgi:hypothetical protein
MSTAGSKKFLQATFQSLFLQDDAVMLNVTHDLPVGITIASELHPLACFFLFESSGAPFEPLDVLNDAFFAPIASRASSAL